METVDEDMVLYLQRSRTLSPEEVERRVAERDREQGPYIPHGQNVHHLAQESRH